MAYQPDVIKTKEQYPSAIVDFKSAHQQSVGGKLGTQQLREINDLSLIPQYSMTVRETRAVARVVVRISDNCSGCIDAIGVTA